MRINKKLNLVIPIDEGEDGAARLYIHSMPISLDVFERYYRLLSRVYSEIWASGGQAILGGARTAALELRKQAEDAGTWDDVQSGLMAEIRRLSNVVMVGPQGWTTIPLDIAIGQKLIDDEDLAEAMGLIVFFILVSALRKRSEIPMTLNAMCGIWKCAVTSSSCTEFAASLPRLTPAGNTGATAKA